MSLSFTPEDRTKAEADLVEAQRDADKALKRL